MKRAADIPTSSLHAETETVSNDLSILRKPIKTSVNGSNEARKAYEDGTDEVRKLLSNECDLVYECKVCRNLFRSLANFISHKRVYCKTTYCSSLQYDYHNDGRGFSQDISTIVQAEEDFIGTARTGKTNDKDLSSIVERLIKREKASRLLKLSDFYEQVNNKLTQDELLQKRHTLQLDVVPESSVAVYQTVKSPNEVSDTIKSEIIEIQNISNRSRTVLGPDGKVVCPSELPEFPDDDDKLAQPFGCEVCSCKFATEKTLKLHIETKHIPSTYVFQCPSCSKTFLQVGQVIRHLTNDHKKSMRRVRLMRDSILKRRTRIDEVQVKGPSRELARLQSDKDRVDSQNKAWLDNLEDNDSSNKNVCLFCGRQFDRRAVLLSHHKVCQLKKKPNTRISLTRKVDQDTRPTSNGWNDREFDDSSNSLDGAFVDETVTISSLKEKTKLMKCEPDVVKNELDPSETTTTNRRKRNRALRAVVPDEKIDSDEEKSLNICWNADEPLKIKEEIVSPVDSAMSDLGNNNTADIELETETIKTEEVNVVREEKRTRTTNGSGIKIHEHKPKSKLTSSHCKYCFKKFSNASNLRRHITMSHFGPKKFTCNLCTFRARRQNDILTHMRTKHQMDGERMDAMKFVTVNDETSPKITQSSFSRRKDKHIEVLQDDEEEIFIDSESFAVEESSDKLITLNMSHENSNTDVDDSNNQCNDSNKSNLKRKGRPKATEKIKKSERSLSPEQKECESLPARRPVRNRIMPVKKDFVYDLSTLIKKDYKEFQIDDFTKQSQSTQPQTQSQPQPQIQSTSQPSVTHDKFRNVSPVTIDNKLSKRRLNLPHTSESCDSQQNTEHMTSDITQKPITAAPTTNTPVPGHQPDQPDGKVPNSNANELMTVKGAAQAMAQKAVQSNRAAFFKPPELPTERPSSKPQRQFDSNTIKDWPVLKRPPAILDGIKSKLTNLKVPGLKHKKRACLLRHGSSNKSSNHKSRVYDKQKANTNGHTDKPLKCNDSDKNEQSSLETKISTKLADKIQLHNAQIENDIQKTTESEKYEVQTSDIDNHTESKTKKNSENATSTPRRMTLLERLAENKTKKLNESLSRMSIANADNDSDED